MWPLRSHKETSPSEFAADGTAGTKAWDDTNLGAAKKPWVGKRGSKIVMWREMGPGQLRINQGKDFKS